MKKLQVRFAPEDIKLITWLLDRVLLLEDDQQRQFKAAALSASLKHRALNYWGLDYLDLPAPAIAETLNKTNITVRKRDHAS
jgi:hypothetical protein